MSKNKSKKEKQSISFLDRASTKIKIVVTLIVLVLPLLYFFLPWEINNVKPAGTDGVASIGQTHKWIEYRNETGETVLWNPNIFTGEPIYPRLTPFLIHIDSILGQLHKYIFTWIFWYLLLGGLGIFSFLRYKNIQWYLALIVAIAFILLPDWYAQIGEGHNSKLRAIMTLPWVFFSFSYLFDKRNWLSAGFFAFCFSWLVRTHHYQIIFYGILVLFFIYFYPIVKEIIDRKYKDVGTLALKFSIALALTFLTAAQPLFTTHEYAKYSTRGGNPVQIGEAAKSAEKGGGVSFGYATQWSFAPGEILDFFIPRFTGGVQGEKYDGEKFVQLKGKTVPGYWGEKPFNGNYATVGIILFMFAILGAVRYRKDKFIVGLAVFVLFSILLSFGRHFPELYKLFFNFVPYFSKFRAPAMILNVTFLTIFILSGFGLKALVSDITEKDYKWVLTIFGGGVVLAIGVILFSDSFAYATANEIKQYDSNNLNMLKEIRKEFLMADTKKFLFFTSSIFLVVVGFLFKKIQLQMFVFLVLILSASELFTISNRVYNDISLTNPDQLEKSIFKDTEITKILKGDTSNKRGIVLGKGLTANHYAYYYPLISGYSAIKLQLIQDVIEHNLYKSESPDKINWNLINMLSGKYIISPAQINNPNIKLIQQDKERKELLYENLNVFERVWFIKNLKVMDTREDLVLYMNKIEFDPANTSLIMDNSNLLQKDFSGEGSIEVTNYTPNKIEYKINTTSDQFAVISEMYYEKGWKAFLGEVEVPIYQVNHLLRGVPVKAGSKKLILEFMPSTYYASLYTVWIGNVIIIGLIIFGLFSIGLFKKLSKQS